MGAALVLGLKAGFAPGDASKVIYVVIAIVIQAVLPVLGHATIIKTLRALAIPFVILFGVLFIFTLPTPRSTGSPGADWQTYMEGLAFTITLSGLGWMECGNDYTRYCAPDASKKAIVGWVFLGTAVPEIVVMTLGAAVATFLPGIGASNHGYGSLYPFAHTTDIPSWFVVIFLLFAIVQLFGINSLDMYSSGVTLQAMGVKVKRYQAVLSTAASPFSSRSTPSSAPRSPRISRTSSTSSSCGSPPGVPSSWSTGPYGDTATCPLNLGARDQRGSVLPKRRFLLARDDRTAGGHVRRHHRTLAHLLRAALVESDHLRHA